MEVLHRIDCEITNRCNAGCPLCPRTGDYKGGVSEVIHRMGYRDIEIDTIQNILDSKSAQNLKHFSYCVNKDIDLLFNNILIYYRKYYNKNKFYNKFNLCKEGKIIIEKIYMEPININNIKNKYTDSFIYDLYIRLKNIEEYDYFQEFQLREIIKKAKFLEKTLDNSEAIGYIRKEFRNVHKFRHGGLNYLDERATKRRNDDISNT